MALTNPKRADRIAISLQNEHLHLFDKRDQQRGQLCDTFKPKAHVTNHRKYHKILDFCVQQNTVFGYCFLIPKLACSANRTVTLQVSGQWLSQFYDFSVFSECPS